MAHKHRHGLYVLSVCKIQRCESVTQGIRPHPLKPCLCRKSHPISVPGLIGARNHLRATDQHAVVASSWHAEFVYADVSYFNKERKAPYLRLRECCEERFARCSFAEDGTHRAMFPFGGWSARTPLAELACLRSGFKRAFRIDCIAGEERSIRTISGHVLIN